MNSHSLVVSEARSSLLRLLAEKITTKEARFLKVAIDGVDGAGKTTFADELAPYIERLGRPVIRASVDGFHQPRALRYAKGKTPESFFLDSYNYPKLKERLLEPLSESGSGLYQSAMFDHRTDRELDPPFERAKPGAILLLDGIFLHRDELHHHWDFSIFLAVDFSVSVPRGAQRGEGFGSPDPKAESNLRYVGGQGLYLRECDPQSRASVVVNNNVLAAPECLAK